MPEQNTNKSHLYFCNPVEGVVEYKQLPRYNETLEEDGIPKHYEAMKESFRTCRLKFNRDLKARHSNRNEVLGISEHIDYILINFWGPFETDKFSIKYKQDFGLAAVKFELFNTRVLFAVEDESSFEEFFNQLNIFQRSEVHTGTLDYNPNIKYIKDFKLLTNADIKIYRQLQDSVILNLVDIPDIFQSKIRPIEDSLKLYLERQKLRFIFNSENQTLQIWNISEAEIEEILSNYDIIHSVNSSKAGVIRPSEFNLPERSFGFTVTVPREGSTIIGLLDSGISNNTPLKSIIINQNDRDYDLTNTGALVDSKNHGTGVGCFAAIGSRLITETSEDKQADAWLLSMKIFTDGIQRVVDKDIIDLIKRAHTEKGVRIFILTVTEQESKKDNESITAFAYLLDKLAYELDILIIISSGNVAQSYFLDLEHVVQTNQYNSYPEEFVHEWTNIKAPSECMNNLTVGACGGNFEFVFNSPGLAIDEKFPGAYSTKYNYEFESGILSSHKSNKHLNKPDVLYYGGDWDNVLGCSQTGITFVSAITGQFFDKSVGTSFSAGLIGNIASKIINQYPQLRMQTVKALIINSSQKPKLSTFFDALSDKIKNRIIGKGIPEEKECLYSDNNSVTIIIEDEIEANRIKSYPINIPEYLIRKNSNSTVLEIKATLCFSFEPLLNHQLAYCPVHIGFGIFKNLPLNETTNDESGKEISTGLNNNKSENIKIKNDYGWSEDYYYKAKILSNVQKIELVYNKQNISENENTFKIAINCKLHKLMNAIQKEKFNRTYKFSLVLNLQERPIKGLLSGNIYNELVAVNSLEAIADLEAELEI